MQPAGVPALVGTATWPITASTTGSMTVKCSAEKISATGRDTSIVAEYARALGREVERPGEMGVMRAGGHQKNYKLCILLVNSKE